MTAMELGRVAKVLGVLASAEIGCTGTMTGDAAERASAADAVHIAELHPLNVGIAGSDTGGRARITRFCESGKVKDWLLRADRARIANAGPSGVGTVCPTIPSRPGQRDGKRDHG